MENPLAGEVPQDGDVFELTLEELRVLSPEAAEEAAREGLKVFWAVGCDEDEEPSLEVEGQPWSVFGSVSESLEDEEMDDGRKWVGGAWD